MTQRELILSKVGSRAVTSIILADETGLSIGHCSNYLSELERRGVLKSLGEFSDRTKVYVRRNLRRFDYLKKQLMQKGDRECLRKASISLARVRVLLRNLEAQPSQPKESQQVTTSPIS